MVFMSSPLDIFQIPIFPFLDPEAKCSPFGENTTLKIAEVLSVRVLNCSPFDNFQIDIVLSLDPDAMYSPFGENTTLWT